MNGFGLGFYLQQPFAYHALIAGTLIAIAAGLLGSFVQLRGAAFFVHGTAELAFAGAAGGLLAANDPVFGALIGAVVVATIIGLLGERAASRDTVIGVVLAFGLGVGRLLLDYLHNNSATTALNILFGYIYGVSGTQLVVLVIIVVVALVMTIVMFRPLLFASVDPELAAARGVPTRVVGLIFLYVLALTVTEAAQIVGTLLVLSLTITPAAAAAQFSARPAVVAGLSVLVALLATDGGLIANLQYPQHEASVFISCIAFGLYLLARAVRPLVSARR